MVLIVTTLVPSEPADVAGTDKLPCDLLEVRLDGLTGGADDVARTLELAGLPTLASCRRASDGGRVDLAEDERRARLEAALAAGCDLIDLEDDAGFRDELTHAALTRGTQVIVSRHTLDGTPSPDELMCALAALRDGADIVKLATRADGPDDVEHLFQAALRAPTLGVPFALMGVGDSGVRALAGPLGMALVYTAPGAAAVPGQLPAHLQQVLPRTPPAPEGFRDYVLLGHPVGHSLSPRMQNAAFSYLGEGARYRLVDVVPDQLKTAFSGLAAMGVAGGNVTSPHKGAVLHLCDDVHPIAAEARAVNTFRFDGDRVHGTNTDGLGIVHALQARGERLDDRRVVVVGAGGTARAAAHALAKAGSHLVCANRTPERADALAAELGAESVPLERGPLEAVLDDGAVLVNATPVDLPVGPKALGRTVVFDATYGPGKAELARRARLAGTRALDGLDLLVHQGDLGLRSWLDLAADDKLLGVMSTAARTGALEQRFQRARPTQEELA